MLKHLSYLFCCASKSTEIDELNEIDVKKPNPSIEKKEPIKIVEFNRSPQMSWRKRNKLSNSDSEGKLNEKLMCQPKVRASLLHVSKDQLHIRRKEQRHDLKPMKPKHTKPEIKKLESEPCLSNWSHSPHSTPPRRRKISRSRSHENFNDFSDKVDKYFTRLSIYLNIDQVPRPIYFTPSSGRKTLDKKDRLSHASKSLSQDAISKQSFDESGPRVSSDLALFSSVCHNFSNPSSAKDQSLNVHLHAKLSGVESRRVHLKICGLKNLGNTCYMNSALQCLVHTEPLRELIEPTDKNKSKTLQTSQPRDRPLASCFSQLIKDMLHAPGLENCNPCDLKKVIENHAPIFKGNSQQDAQELITLFIGGLHEEFNEITGKKPYVTMEVDESQFESEEEIAEEWRKLSERRDKSKIIEIFYGQIKCTMKCQNSSCGHEQKTYELVFPLTLPIPKKPDVSLKDCLKLYTKEKKSTDPWYCEECNDVVTLSRKVEMWNMPQILMVYFKRFCLKGGIHTKINEHVKFDFMFPLENFCPKEKEQYQLYAVINHNGSLQFGHYYAFVKCQDKWYECNDSMCTEISVDNVITSSAYVLFYERVKVNESEAYLV